MAVGSLEEIIDDNHAIVSTSVGSEHYVSILSFVDKDSLEPGCTVLLNHKVTHAGWVLRSLADIKTRHFYSILIRFMQLLVFLGDDTDPMVTVMKLEKGHHKRHTQISVV